MFLLGGLFYRRSKSSKSHSPNVRQSVGRRGPPGKRENAERSSTDLPTGCCPVHIRQTAIEWHRRTLRSTECRQLREQWQQQDIERKHCRSLCNWSTWQTNGRNERTTGNLLASGDGKYKHAAATAFVESAEQAIKSWMTTESQHNTCMQVKQTGQRCYRIISVTASKSLLSPFLRLGSELADENITLINSSQRSILIVVHFYPMIVCRNLGKYIVSSGIWKTIFQHSNTSG